MWSALSSASELYFGTAAEVALFLYFMELVLDAGIIQVRSSGIVSMPPKSLDFLYK